MARLLPVTILLFIPMFVLGSEPTGKEIRRLVVALDDANIRQGASIALANLGQPAVPALRKSLVSESKDVRLWSAYTLGQIGPLAASAVETLLLPMPILPCGQPPRKHSGKSLLQLLSTVSSMLWMTRTTRFASMQR